MTTLQHDSHEATPLHRLFGVLIGPREVFDGLADTEPDRAHWVYPLILYIACATVCTQIILSQPGPAAQLQEAVQKEFVPKLEEFVSSGTLTPSQAEWMERFITPGTVEFFIIQLAGTTAAAWVALFVLGFLVWQLARTVLARGIPYKKALEIVGLTFVIATLERITSMALVVATGTLYASPTPALFLLPNTDNTLFLLLSTLNVFTFWEIAVAAIGVSSVCGRDFPKVFVLFMALWLLWTLASVFPLITGV